MTLDIAIMDDEQVFRESLEKRLRQWAKETENLIKISSFERAIDLIDAWETQTSFDVVFLDIRMRDNDYNGIETAYMLREQDSDVAIVFITNLSDYLAEGYRVDAVRYLLKPLQDYDFKECMERLVLKLRSKESEVFILRTREKMVRIPYSEILYFSSANNYIDIHTTKETFHYLRKLKYLEDTFPPQFVRCHRTVIVNIENISAIIGNEIVLENKERLPISKQHLKEVQEKFIQYYG